MSESYEPVPTPTTEEILFSYANMPAREGGERVNEYMRDAFNRWLEQHDLEMLNLDKQKLRIAVHQGIMPNIMIIFNALGSQEAYDLLLDDITESVLKALTETTEQG